MQTVQQQQGQGKQTQHQQGGNTRNSNNSKHRTK